MPNLELSTNELLMLKDVILNDMEMLPDSEYDGVALMQYYLDRATVLKKVREKLGVTIVHEEEEV